MDVAFVKDSENHIHDENGADQKQRQRLEKLTENKRFALESRLDARIVAMNLSERIFDEFRRVTDRDAGQQIEIDRDAGELIEVVDRLRTNNLLVEVTARKWNEIGCRAGSRGDSATASILTNVTAIASNIQIVEIGRESRARCLLLQE